MNELDERTESRLAELLRSFTVEQTAERDAYDLAGLRQRHEARWSKVAARRSRAIVVGVAACLLVATGVSIGVVETNQPNSSHLHVGVPPRNKQSTTATVPTVVGPHIVLTNEDETEMQALLMKYRAMPGVTRAEAKLVPYTDVEMIPGVRGGSPVSSPPSLVVAIALSGHITPSGPAVTTPDGRSVDMSYELLILDLTTGTVLSDTGGYPETWPTGFDAMPNLPVGTVVPLPTTLVLGLTDNGKTFVIAPSSTITVSLAGSPTTLWQLPPTPHVDSPVLVETNADNGDGSLTSDWTAAIDGTQTIDSVTMCATSAPPACTSTTWSVKVTVRG